ncbi:LysE family translocator [Shewanella olleyana]|uniref:LysE family transporter n=1 Tax=Shewanella olleyana TaxID=135626 RepID=UPI00200FBE1C|nr:LysE family translocator [Shewanella olleyana]MCL1065482.1 LysE family translocator [Shewanella olleyana]
MDFALLSTLAVIHCLALISPGPDFAIIVKTSTQQSRQTALMCATGISVAILLHSLMSLLGISLMIQQSEIAYLAVQLIGVSYLAYMGFGAISSVLTSNNFQSKNEFKNPTEENQNAETSKVDKEDKLVANRQFKEIKPSKGFQLGLYTNLLNPKALIFFITIFTVLVTPQVTIETKVASAALLFSLSVIWFCFLAIMLTKPIIQKRMVKGSKAIDAITGVIFMGVAITILISLINVHIIG